MVNKCDHLLLDIVIDCDLCDDCQCGWMGGHGFICRRQKDMVKAVLALPNGIPSHDTFKRVLKTSMPTSFSSVS